MNPPVSTQRIMYSIARRVGLEPIGDDANLSETKTREILEFMDVRLKEGWELYDFVETTFVEERAFTSDFDPKVSYRCGDVVWDWCSRLYYQALVPTTGGSLSNTVVWKANVSPYPRMVPWWQENRLKIGTAFTAWNKNPYTDQNRTPVPFLLSRHGLEFSLGPVLQTVWIQFRVPYPGIASDAWNSTETYNTGDAAYYGMDTYLSKIDGNVGKTPPTATTWDDNWEMFRIPWVFRTFVTLAAFSDTLIVNGQNEKAPDQLNQAYAALSGEYDKQSIQAGQFSGYSARVL